jgi:hypothetical protein
MKPDAETVPHFSLKTGSIFATLMLTIYTEKSTFSGAVLVPRYCAERFNSPLLLKWY